MNPDHHCSGRIIRARDALTLREVILGGDWELEARARAIGGWLQDWRRGGMPQLPLCLSCPHEFKPDGPPPPAFVTGLITPVAGDERAHVVVTAICKVCAKQDDPQLLTYWVEHVLPVIAHGVGKPTLVQRGGTAPASGSVH
jgi:hypothetical protein